MQSYEKLCTKVHENVTFCDADLVYFEPEIKKWP